MKFLMKVLALKKFTAIFTIRGVLKRLPNLQIIIPCHLQSPLLVYLHTFLFPTVFPLHRAVVDRFLCNAFHEFDFIP